MRTHTQTAQNMLGIILQSLMTTLATQLRTAANGSGKVPKQQSALAIRQIIMHHLKLRAEGKLYHLGDVHFWGTERHYDWTRLRDAGILHTTIWKVVDRSPSNLYQPCHF